MLPINKFTSKYKTEIKFQDITYDIIDFIKNNKKRKHSKLFKGYVYVITV